MKAEIRTSCNTKIVEYIVKEYLLSLIILKKWNDHYRNINTNDLIQLQEDNALLSYYRS